MGKNTLLRYIFTRTGMSLFHWFNYATWLPSKSLYKARKFPCTAIWRNHILIFKLNELSLSIYGPRKNKSFIRFVTDCPRLCVGLLNLASPSMRLNIPTYRRRQSVTNPISNIILWQINKSQVKIMIWQVNIKNWQVNIIIWQVVAEMCHHTIVSFY